MDLYSAELIELGRHQTMAEQVSRTAHLAPLTGQPALATWLAGRLRRAADRLDPRPALDTPRPAVIRSIRRPAP